MVNLLRRKRRQASSDPTGDDLGQDLAAVTSRVTETVTAQLGRPVEIAEGPDPVIGGHGPDVYRLRLAAGGSGAAGAAGSAGAARDDAGAGDGAGPEAGGGDAEAWSGDLLVRCTAPEVLAHEVAWMEAVAAAGFPAPEALAHDPDRELLVLRAPAGTSLTECLLVDMASVSQLLGDMGRLHARLHGLPAERVAADARARGGSTIDSHEELAARATGATVQSLLADELDWLDHHTPPAGRPVVCHGELHSSHVYLDRDDPSATEVVNWTVARLADPEMDVAYAMTAFWFAPYYLDNPMYRKVMKMARESLASAYLEGYRSAEPELVDDDRLHYWEAFHLGSLATDLAHRVHHGPRHRWDPMAGVVNPERTLDELRERFWELARR